MRASSRWRAWQPKEEKFGNMPLVRVPKVPKPIADPLNDISGTFGTLSLGEDIANLWDPDAWEDDLHNWGLSHCTFQSAASTASATCTDSSAAGVPLPTECRAG